MVTTRTVRVSGIPYLQVVDYKKAPDGKSKIDVVRSFGKDTLENRMRAEQFEASYNKLREMALEHREQQNNGNDFMNTALAIFGIILGAALVAGVLREIFGEE